MSFLLLQFDDICCVKSTQISTAMRPSITDDLTEDKPQSAATKVKWVVKDTSNKSPSVR